jgi:hypothetical protein
MEWITAFVVVLASIAAGWHLRRWYVGRMTPAEHRLGEKYCAVCQTQLHRKAHRCHDGRYLCLKHKGGL